ncbi:hypothetical protein [Microbacterium cremeum]|uniref:hypothetical protein n=1 Tax=Microbacterium cremeum TaxID=2782169 RepID=UPI0018884FB7|nr:hypothetical protein [Microbacterium cremeum]
MDTAALEELRALRARAYGPHADIDQDPRALRRLRELEAQTSGSTTRSSAAAATGVTSTLPAGSQPQPESAARADVAVDAATAGMAPGTGTEAAPAAGTIAVGAGTPEGEGAPVDGTHDDAPPADSASSGSAAGRRHRLSRRMRLLWGLSAVASAAVASGITYAVTSMAPVSVSSGAPQIATLKPSPLIEIPVGWLGAGPSSRAFEFYGLTLFETTHGYFGAGSDCFTAVPTEQLPEEDTDTNSWSFSGNMYAGCGVGNFPATVEIPIDSGMPEELRDRFPPGSALQFVLDGDRMGVFLDSP